MTLEEFKHTYNQILPPAHFSVQLQALWYDAKGDWRAAHDLIDHLEDLASAHLHAYLHRVEGDLWNARYWYNKARQPEYTGSFEEEWVQLFHLSNG